MRNKQQYTMPIIGAFLMLLGIILLLFVFFSFPRKTDPEKGLSGSTSENITDETSDQSIDVDPVHEQLSENTDQFSEASENEQYEKTDASENTDTELLQEEPEVAPDGSENKMTVDASLWNLILVNPDNYLPEDYSFEKEQVQGNYYLDSRIAPSARQMIEDAKNEGIELQVCSSIRDIDLQTRLFNNKIDDLISEGYSEEDAKIKAATIVAVPGTSEHHTGLAFDIVTPSYQRLNSGYAETDAAKWLKANAARYGFILRYPEDKTEITKIIFEPWHYRYVGVEYAEFIMSEGICLEEFLELYASTED